MTNSEELISKKTANTNNYLEIAREGKTDWWRYLISIPAIVFTYFLGGFAVVIILLLMTALYGNNPHEALLKFVATNQVTSMGIPIIIGYISLNLLFLPLLFTISLSTIIIHKRKLKTLITPLKSINWKKILIGFFLWILIAGFLTSVVEILIFPGAYKFTFDFGQWLEFLPVAIFFTIIQATTEELLFRAYMIQWFGLKIKKEWVLVLLTGLFFLLAHLSNTEAISTSLLYKIYYFINIFGIGAFLSFVTLRDKSLEFAIGMHIANNLFAVLFVSYTNSTLPSPSMFINTLNNPIYGTVSFVLSLTIVYLLYFKLLQPKLSSFPNLKKSP